MENLSLKPHHKDNFQLERIALFSDAVFAIALTLLVIEIKIPEIHMDKVTDGELFEALLLTVPKFIGFLVSFFVIGLYWLAHHRIFNYVVKTSNKLLWANLLFLLPIVIMPFSTGFLSEYYNASLRLPLALYTVNISFSGFFSFRLWKIIGKQENHLSVNLDKITLHYNMIRSLAIPIVFVCAFLFSLVSPSIAYLIPPVTPLMIYIIKKYFKKKYQAVEGIEKKLF